MSWTADITRGVQATGGLANVSDVTVEIADSAASKTQDDDGNPIGSVLQAPVRAGLTALGWMGNQYYTRLVQPVHDFIVWEQLAAQSPFWKPQGMSTWDYVRPFNDQQGSAWGARDNLSVSEAAAAFGVGLAQKFNPGGEGSSIDRKVDPLLRGMSSFGQIGGAGYLASLTSPLMDDDEDPRWQRYNPVTNPEESRDVWRGTPDKDGVGRGGSPYRYGTGIMDFSKDLALDPMTVAGGPVKGALASVRGARLVSETEYTAMGRLKGLSGAISVDEAFKALDAGKFDGAVQHIAAETSPLRLATWVDEAGLGVRDPATFGRLGAELTDPEDVKSLFSIMWNPASDDALQAADALKAKYGAGFHYEASRMAGKNPLHEEILGTSGDLIDGPATAEVAEDIASKVEKDPVVKAALKRAESFSRGLDTVMFDSQGERLAGPFMRNAPARSDSVIGRSAQSGAEKRANRLTMGVTKDPVVTEYKPSRWHPSVLIHEKPSGFINPENPDSFREMIAVVREMDHTLDGAFVNSGEADKFIQRWMDAATLTDPQAARGSIASGMNDYLVRSLAIKHGVPADMVDDIVQAASDKTARMRKQLNEKGWLSFVTDGGDISVLKSPVLQRATPNSIQMYDARGLDRAFARVGKDEMAKMSETFINGTVTGMDFINNVFKVSVLLRLGYTVRNLSEAALSVAATGNLGAVLAAVGPERVNTWLKSGYAGTARLIDRVGISMGAFDDVRALSDQITANLSNHAVLNQQVEDMLDGISRADVKKLARSKDAADRALAEKIETLRTVLGERQTTYHATDRKAFSPEGALSTSPSMSLTQRYADGFRTGASWAEGKVPKVGQGTLSDQTAAKTGREVRSIQSFGSTLDLVANRGAMGFDSSLVAKARKGDGAAVQQLSDAAFEKGYARVVLPDVGDFGGVQVVVNSKAVGAEGLRSVVSRKLAKALEDVGPVDVPTLPKTWAQRRAERSAASSYRAKGNQYPSAIDPNWDRTLVQSMLDNGLEIVAQQLAVRKSALESWGHDLAARREVARRRAVAHAPLRQQGKAFGGAEEQVVSLHGVDYGKVKGPFGDTGGGWWEKALSNDSTYHTLFVGSDQGPLAVGAAVSKQVDPSDPRYFEAWSNILNMHFRDPQSLVEDPVVMKILSGESFDDLYDWATKTRAGYNWTHSIGIVKTKGADTAAANAEKFINGAKRTANPKKVEEAIAGLRSAVDMYLPEGPIRQAFLAGDEITADLLQQASKGSPLHPLRGLLIPTSAEARDGWRLRDRLSHGVTQTMRVLGTIPETSFARHPLFLTEYRRERATRIAIAEEQVGRQLTNAEFQRIVLDSKRAAKSSVERTLFTIVRRSNLSSNALVRLTFPFVSAYENVLRRWGRFVKDDPTLPMRASVLIAKMTHGAVIVDSEGNRVTDPTRLGDEGVSVVLPGADSLHLPGRWGRAAESMAQRTLAPVKSFDLLFQGDPTNPGFGPYSVIAASEIVKHVPSMEDNLKFMFPYGLPEGPAWQQFLPTALKRALTKTDENSTAFVNSVSKIALYEQYRYENGQRPDKPEMPEILEKAKAYWDIRTLAAITSPVATQFTNERDWYASKLRSLQKTHGREKGEALFFQQFPNTDLLVQSLSKNPGGVAATPGAVANLQKYQAEAAEAYAQGDPELAGFIANFGQPKDSAFSEAAYQWEWSNSPDGTGNTYRQAANPTEAVREAHVKQGWTLWRQVVDTVTAQLDAVGISPESPYYRDRLSAAKQAVVKELVENQGNKDWYAEYSDPDTSKYFRRADFFKKLLSDSDFVRDHSDDPLVRSISVYFQYRDQVQQILAARKAAGQPGTLQANANYDVASEWETVVNRLKADSPEFSAWADRYFINDPVGVY